MTKFDYSMSHEDIGKVLGLSKMRICQIEKKALEKVKLRLERLGVTKEIINDHINNRERGEEGQYEDAKYGFVKSVLSNKREKYTIMRECHLKKRF